MQIELKILNKDFYNEDNLPHYATAGSAAIDLICTEDVIVSPNDVKMVHTGLALSIGQTANVTRNEGGWCNVVMQDVAALILPRSGLGSEGLILGNTIGLIDSDYQGEIMVSLWNRRTDTGKYSFFCLNKGDRFAQMVFVPIMKPTFKIVDEFSNITERNDGGFGSTGK